MNPPSSPLAELHSPPKPPLAFRVGIVGHRPDRLQEADMGLLGRTLRGILQAVQDEVGEVARTHAEFFDGGTPALRAVSPLAEGTDRLFADQALALGWELTCVMPFPKDEYEKDFAGPAALEPDSLARFRGLLAQATANRRLSCLQLDGVRGQEESSSAYRAAGSAVLGLCDLLVAVWDGVRPLDKPGGTAGTIDEAKQAGTPLIWVDAKAPHSWSMGTEKDSPVGDEAIVREMVRHALLPSSPIGDLSLNCDPDDKSERPEQCLRVFFAEKKPVLNLAILWKMFRNFVGDCEFPAASPVVKPFEQDVLKDWSLDASTPVAALTNQLRPFYAWPDKLADLYADHYRSGFILCYFLAAAAVGFALLPMGTGSTRMDGTACAMELTCIVLVLVLFFTARFQRWHERWLDYRLAAELVRHLRIAAPICGKPPLPPVPAYHTMHGLPESTWMNWYLRAVSRAARLADTKLDRDYLLEHLKQLRALLLKQCEFHAKGSDRSHRIDHNLHLGIGISLGFTALACLLHLVHAPIPARILTFICGFLPAVGAALGAINNQGEFRRMERRSGAMQDSITRKIEGIDKLTAEISAAPLGKSSFFPKVRDLSTTAADLLVREVLDWRVLFLDRPPGLGT